MSKLLTVIKQLKYIVIGLKNLQDISIFCIKNKVSRWVSFNLKWQITSSAVQFPFVERLVGPLVLL